MVYRFTRQDLDNFKLAYYMYRLRRLSCFFTILSRYLQSAEDLASCAKYVRDVLEPCSLLDARSRLFNWLIIICSTVIGLLELSCINILKNSGFMFVFSCFLCFLPFLYAVGIVLCSRLETSLREYVLYSLALSLLYMLGRVNISTMFVILISGVVYLIILRIYYLGKRWFIIARMILVVGRESGEDKSINELPSLEVLNECEQVEKVEEEMEHLSCSDSCIDDAGLD